MFEADVKGSITHMQLFDQFVAHDFHELQAVTQVPRCAPTTSDDLFTQWHKILLKLGTPVNGRNLV